MKLIKKRIIKSIVLGLVGLVLLIITLVAGDSHRISYISGSGAALLVIGILKTIQLIRLSRNEKWVQKFEIEQHEERVIFLANKSGALVFWMTIVAELIAICIFVILNKIDYTLIISYVLCAQVFVYYIVYYILNKRY